MKCIRTLLLSFVVIGIVTILHCDLSFATTNNQIASSLIAANRSRLSDNDLMIYSRNSIMFYNPAPDCRNVSGGSCGAEVTGTSVRERRREVVEKYGIFFMNAQIEYGIPWEVPIIHSQLESQFGLAENSVARSVEACGNYNWQGYKYGTSSLFGISEEEMGECKAYHGDDGALASQYVNLADMYMAFYTDYLRNGYYYAAFEYATPDNFDVRQFIYTETQDIYCSGPSCGQHYLSTYDSSIDEIHAIAKEKGWPTSEELMREYNIQKGGNWPNVGENIKNHINAEPHSLNAGCSSMTVLGDTSGFDYGDSSSSSSSSQNTSSTSSSSTSYSNVTWEDGWITGGFDGYIKEAAIGSSYSLAEDGVGGGHNLEYSTDGKPNKILLHSTEGNSGGSGLALYGTVTKTNGYSGITPAHFTIDLKGRKVFQHFSISKPSDAIAIGDEAAGVQIEIIGFSDSRSAGSPNYLLNENNFSSDDWAYLGKLLSAISAETGIPLTTSVNWENPQHLELGGDFESYEGILGHMHAPTSPSNHRDPNNIWSFVEAAIGSVPSTNIGDSYCKTTTELSGFSSYVMNYAWTIDELTEMGTNQKDGTLTPKPGYKEVYDRRISENKYVGSHESYADCGGFVTTLMAESGYEPNYNSPPGNTTTQTNWLEANWEKIGVSGGSFDTSQLRPGDVYARPGHTFVFVGDIEGFGSDIASASLNERVPQAGGNSATDSGFGIYRKKGQ